MRFAEGLYINQLGAERPEIPKSDFVEKTQEEILVQIASDPMQ
jgi:hypothetical protein